MKLVLDASVALNWLSLPSQPFREAAFRILEGLDDYVTYVPTIWHLEVAHGAMRAERSGMASASMLTKFSEILSRVCPSPKSNAPRSFGWPPACPSPGNTA